MNIKRALEALEKEDFISVFKKYESEYSGDVKIPPIYMIKIHKGGRLLEAITDTIAKTNEMLCSTASHSVIEFFDGKEVKKWLESECTKSPTYIFGMPGYMATWVKDNTDYEQSIDDHGYFIINKKDKKTIDEKAIKIWRDNLW